MAKSDDNLHLLLLEEHHMDAGANLRAGLASLAAHLLLVPGLIWLVFFAPQPPRLVTHGPLIDVRKAIHLTAPVLPKEKIATPTQVEPNRGKPAMEVSVESLQSRTPPKTFELPSAPRPATPPPGPIAPPEPPKIEAPKIAQAAPPVFGNPSLPPAPPAPAPGAAATPNQKPKLTFETPGAQFGTPQGAPQVKLAPPKQSVEEAIRKASKPGGGGLTVGDEGGENNNPFAPPSRRGTASSLELLSDPQGVDFRPYLQQILATVRRNWLAVIPESARLEGRRGRVLIQFIVDRGGKVPKLVIASPSGAEALDRAAVTGISASHPFPPLPPGFKGDQVKLQFAFTYNMNR